MRGVLMCVAVMCSTATAIAQTTGAGGSGGQAPAYANERLREALEPGVVVSIIDDSGRRIEGPVREFSSEMLRVFRRGQLETVQMDRIVRIERPDGVGDGALKGLTVGLTMGVLGGGLNAGEVENKAAFIVASAFGNGLIFAALGTGLDALFDHSKTLYERRPSVQLRVSPLFARGAGGGALLVHVKW